MQYYGLRRNKHCKSNKMYEIDHKDQVVELKEIPQSSTGAPTPIILAGEHDVLLTYYLENTPKNWDGTSVRAIDTHVEGEPVAVVQFTHCTAHMFGPPNDETFSGHPLSNRGLCPYGVFEVKQSSWIRKLERMNAVHPYHDKERFMKNKRHFVFAFHDSTFECIAADFTIEVATGSVSGMIPRMLERLL